MAEPLFDGLTLFIRVMGRGKQILDTHVRNERGECTVCSSTNAVKYPCFLAKAAKDALYPPEGGNKLL